MPDTNTKKDQDLIYVITGKDDALVNGECEKLLDKLIAPQQRATGLFNPDPGEVPACDILDELRTAPFLTDKRVVIVRRADKFISDNRDVLEKYFDSPCPSGILILTTTAWDSRTKLAKKLPKVGKLITLAQPRSNLLPGRLAAYARDAHQKSLQKEAAELLIELTGEELGRLYIEIDKLALFVGTEKTITARDAESLIGHNRLFSAFAVIDAILAGDIAQAAGRLRSMFAADKSTEYTVVGAFAYHFRRMFQARVMLQKGLSETQITERLRIWSHKEDFFLRLRKMSLKQIGGILSRLADIDYAIKTGRTTARTAMEQLVLELTAEKTDGSTQRGRKRSV